MTAVPALTVTPAGAANAYARVSEGSGGSGFGDVLTRALDGVVGAGRRADTQAMRAIAGNGNLTEVAAAVSHAELAMQTALAIRDRAVQAYQDIMRMPI